MNEERHPTDLDYEIHYRDFCESLDKASNSDQHSKNHNIYINFLKLLYKMVVKYMRTTKNETPC